MCWRACDLWYRHMSYNRDGPSLEKASDFNVSAGLVWYKNCFIDGQRDGHNWNWLDRLRVVESRSLRWPK